MTINGWVQIALYSLILIALTKPLGGYMTRVFNGERTFLSPVLRPLERGVYAVCGISEAEEQHWVTYAIAMLAFSLAGFVTMYAIQRLQTVLPLNPQGEGVISQDLAFNTSVSFLTNTNWQSYTPETTMSYLTQMAGLAVHNFVSAATGIALAIALVRGFARRSAQTIGNFWVDLTRCVLYILLPISVFVGLFFIWQGVPQNFNPYTAVMTLEGAKQLIAQGPVASQEAIKILGTNGGGFFNANSSHPFENPTALTNLVQMLSMLSIGAALTNVFGRMVGGQRQGWAIFAVMFVLFLGGVTTCYWAESAGNPAFAAFHVDQTASALQPGGNMEGKEVRFGIANSALFTTTTTDASCGAVNNMHDSLLPLAGAVPMVNIMLGEIIYGGVGSGLYGMLLFVIIAMFVAGLMVGRTPEYLGKKLEAKEVKMAMLAILILPFSMLGFTALAVVLPVGTSAMANAGPHGFSEALYAYTSATGNNGSAFAGLSANVPFWNDTLGMAMFMGRFLMIIPMLAIAGSLARKKIVPASLGTFPTTSPLFVGLVIGVIAITGGLIFFPAVSLGPIVENFAMRAGTLYKIQVSPMEVRNRRGARSSIFDTAILAPAIGQSLKKLDPRILAKNPVMFVVEIVATLTTVVFIRELITGGGHLGFTFQIIFWLWLTVIFANFAEAVAEGRGKAQAATLRRARTETMAKRLSDPQAALFESVPAHRLIPGDVVLVEAGELIPSDGDVIEGIASVDESAITGESAPVIRESGGDRSAVTGGTRVLSDWIKVKITAAQGSTFLDRMIALVEGAERQKTPNEIALNILLAGLTIIFVIVVATIPSFVTYAGGAISVVVLVALFVALIPTTIGALLSAIGIAGMDRLVRFNVLAMSGRAVEAAGDVDTLLLDKTGTITLGNRQATEFFPVSGVTETELADAAQLASLPDETPEGRSIVVLAKEKYQIRGREMAPMGARFIPFSAQTRLSGIDYDGSSIRKGAVDAVLNWVRSVPDSGNGGGVAVRAAISDAAVRELTAKSDEIAKAGGTPLAVARDGRLLGVIYLKDIVKGGISERFAELRRMGIRTVMITGDNPLTAAAIAAESGVDDFLAQATPETKLKLIREEQAQGKLVAMCGDGTNDAPALAQADVGVAMNTGTMAAREAGNMVDLDSDPTKLIEIVEIGKQLLMTRGALTTFSIANDVAKYFAMIPAMFLAFYPQLGALNVMHLANPQSAILSAIIFNALIIVALIPLALRGVAYRPIGAAALLRRNLLIYGLGEIIAPFVGIKLLDLLVTSIGLA